MSDKTYSEVIANMLKGKLVEVHTGDTRHSHQYSDYTITKKSIIRGVVVQAEGDVLVLECIVSSASGKPLKDNPKTKVYLNGWNILLITEYEHGSNTVNIFHDEDTSLK
jgi:hypothetical protein